MFEKCVKCERLGKDCIPNICIMSVDDAREWAKKVKAYKRMSNAELAKQSGVPIGTIGAHFSKKTHYSADVNYSTFAPIFCALIGCSNQEMECPKEPGKNVYSDADVEMIMDDEEKRIDYLKEQIKRIQKTSDNRMKAVVILGVLLGLTLFIIIFALVMDGLYSDRGFLWISNISN